jgi:hypothetical protein
MTLQVSKLYNFFLIGIVGGGVPFWIHSALRPPALGDYDGETGGMMTCSGNRSTQREPAPVPLCPPQSPHDCSDVNPGRRGRKPATNRLSYGTAYRNCVTPSDLMINKYEAVSGIRTRKPKQRKLKCSKKTRTSATFSTTNPHDLACDRTWAAAEGSRIILFNLQRHLHFRVHS